jgi:hypothetical protein
MTVDRGRLHLPGFIAHLPFREAQRRQPCLRVRLIATVIRRLLARSAVMNPAVCLDDQTQVGPVEVDPIAAHPCLRFRQRQAGVSHNAEELALEPGVGERIAAEQPTEARHPGPRRQALHIGS